MTEHKSPPGPREMVQEWRAINSNSGIQFVEEGAAVGVDGERAEHVALDATSATDLSHHTPRAA